MSRRSEALTRLGKDQSEGYRFLDHVTDALIEAWGPDMEHAFAQAGIALFETMLHVERVEPLRSDTVQVRGHDELELLYNWLEALLLKFEVENRVYSRFEIVLVRKLADDLSLESSAVGEEYDEAKHGRKVGVKGITYHQMYVRAPKGEHAVVRFLLDL